MPTILSHPAVPLALAAAAGQRLVGPRLLLAGIAASVLPDADVLGFRFGVAYAHELGHRGFTHSLAFALLLALLAMACAPQLRASRGVAFLFVLAAGASHGLLDMLTTGGHGIAWWWPWSTDRFFFPTQVIEVSTLNLRRFLGPAGWAVLRSEFIWVWMPATLVALGGIGLRRLIHSHPLRPRN